MPVTTIADSVLSAIGRTPVARLRRVVTAGAADVLVKLEFFNPTCSYKDRMALAMIEGAERARLRREHLHCAAHPLEQDRRHL